MTIKGDDIKWCKGCGFTRTVMESTDWTVFTVDKIGLRLKYHNGKRGITHTSQHLALLE